MKTKALLLISAAAALVTGCESESVHLSASREDLPFMQVTTVRSEAQVPVFVERVVANHNEGSMTCNRSVGSNLSPEGYLQVTFVGCGKVGSLDVYTNKGEFNFDFT